MAKDTETRDLATVLDESMSLADAVDLDFQGWTPEPGDKLVGHVLYVGTTTGTSPELGSYPIVGIVTDDGEPVNLHCFHTVLRNAVERWNPERGDRIAVKYFGWAKKLADGSTERTGKARPANAATIDGYDAYNVIVQKATAA